MAEPIQEKCTRYPAMFCKPDACGQHKLCKAERIYDMLTILRDWLMLMQMLDGLYGDKFE